MAAFWYAYDDAVDDDDDDDDADAGDDAVLSGDGVR